MAYGRIGLTSQCPRPGAPPAPPPAPAPSAPLTSMTTTGLARNGPTHYRRFRRVSGSGGVTLRNGQDANAPVLHSVSDAPVGVWQYPAGVTPADEASLAQMYSAYLSSMGAGEIELDFRDFVGSLYPVDIPEPTVTQEWYVIPKGAAATTNAGTPANPFNGSRALQNAIAAGTVTRGHRVNMIRDYGPLSIATEGADWPSTRSISTAFPEGSALSSGTTNPGGMIFGSSMIASSNASGIWFKNFLVDWSGATSITNRAWAGIRFQGEDIWVTDIEVIPPNWSPLFDPDTLATRIARTGQPADGAGNSSADKATYENHGIILAGNGNVIRRWKVTGDGTWSRYALCYFVAEEAIAGSANKRGEFAYGEASGCLCGWQVQAFGQSGYDLETPTYVQGHHNWVHDGSYGKSSKIPTGANNCQGHGNGGGSQGKFFGGHLLFQNEVEGNYQDGLGVAMCAGAVVAFNYIHDLGAASYTEHYWTGTAWGTRTIASSNEGNAIKTGLNTDGSCPSGWLLDDGVAGGTLAVAEQRNIVVGNVIRRVRGSAITSNISGGGFVHSNEAYDFGGAFLLLVAAATSNYRNRNWYVSHNFARKLITSSTGAVVRAESRTNSTTGITYFHNLWMYNNIWWSNYPTVSTHYELFLVAGTVIRAAKGNVCVNNRRTGATYPTADDFTDAASRAAAQEYQLVTVTGGQTEDLVFSGGGLPPGNILIGAGDPTPITESRTYGSQLNLLGDAISETAPNVGPI